MKKKYLPFVFLTVFAFSLGACSEVEQAVSSEEHSTTDSLSSSSTHTHVLKDRTVIIKEATCTEKGSYMLITYCSKCNEELNSQLITLPALGHVFVYSSDSFGFENTALEVCQRCGFTRIASNSFPASSQAPAESSERYPYPQSSQEVPIESSEWYPQSTISVPSSNSVVTHAHVWDWGTPEVEDYAEIDKPATCTEAGHKTYYCECGETKVVIIKKLGHDWGEWVEKTAVTCTKNGVQERECSRCHEIERRTIDATGHDWGEWHKQNNSTLVRECSRCGGKETALSDFDVKIDTKDGTDPVISKVEFGSPITRPADPVAPAGKTFYGWINVENGGQIWNFEDEWLNAVYGDVTLEPLFIDSSLVESKVEAELAPIITEANNGTGLYGATYSGGQIGRRLIYKDYYGEYNIEPMYINEEDNSYQYESVARYATDSDPADEVYGAFVHFLYVQGSKLTYVVESSEAVENAVIFMKIASEYGRDDIDPNDVQCTFTDEMFPVRVNGTPLQYGTITVHGIVLKEFMPFQDYLLSTTVSLNAGTNIIEMEVANNVHLFGNASSTAPMIDCLKIYAPSALTCTNAKLANLNRDW